MLAITFQHIKNPTDLWFLAKRAVYRLVLERRMDQELYQLRMLRRAYSKADGPDILLFGDSAMFYTSPDDPKRRSLDDMIRDDLGRDVRIMTLVGPGYSARIVNTFLTALEDCRSQPALIIVPTSVLMSQELFSESPRLGYIHETRTLREIIEKGGKVPLRGIARSPVEEYEEHDRVPAPSLFGARRTVGEIRLITNSVPTTRWATAVRMRHLMDYYNAERLEAESPGVVHVRDLGTQVAKLSIPTVAYIAPVNHMVLRTTLGEKSLDHLRHNADVIATAFHDTADRYGTVVDAVFDSPSSEFVDPVHLTLEGRERMAHHLSSAIRPLLFPGTPTTSQEDSR